MGYSLKFPVASAKLADEIKAKHYGKNRLIHEVCRLSDCKTTTAMAFSTTVIDETKRGVFLCPEQNTSVAQAELTLLMCDNPKLSFAKVVNWLDSNIGFERSTEPPTIGKNAIIHPTAVIEDGCIIGDDVIIEAYVVVNRGTTIGNGSRLRSHCNVGGDGFGFINDELGTPVRMPHLGGVQIGSNVEVGCFTAICRGTLSDTVIGNNVKIDNLVHIAHNVTIGHGSMIVACAEISGSVTAGNGVWIGPNASVRQKLMIGNSTFVGIGTNVVKDVEESTTVAGNPAKVMAAKTSS
jgi:UDP-3-O-[3-hydroxymyristoyl] glucosamine N-acyltransferase